MKRGTVATAYAFLFLSIVIWSVLSITLAIEEDSYKYLGVQIPSGCAGFVVWPVTLGFILYAIIKKQGRLVTRSLIALLLALGASLITDMEAPTWLAIAAAVAVAAMPVYWLVETIRRGE